LRWPHPPHNTDGFRPTIDDGQHGCSPRPLSDISEQLAIAIIAKLRQTMPDSELFPDSFSVRCFIDPAELFRIICARDFAPITPFVAICCHIIEVLDTHLGPEVALAIITQLGLVSLSASKRIVNAVIEPIFNRRYDEVLKEKLLYLEMGAEQLMRIVDILTIDDPDQERNRR
jgi:hypothetical protein